MRRVGQVLLYLVTSVGLAAAALAQDPAAGVSQPGPGFYYVASANAAPARLDVRRTPVLSRRITLDMRDVTLEAALEEIRRQAGLKLMYSSRLIPLAKKVSIKAEAITVASALAEVLFEEEVDVMFSASTQAMLVPRGEATAAIAQTGTIAGRVIDATTHQGIEGVRVFLEGTRWATTTGTTGSYRLTGVTAGAYTLVTRRLGYKAFERAVVVEDDREVTLDVTLEAAPSALNEVVVTATGEQRRVELGHVVGRINADSLVREAPVTTISELLTSRVPGLQAFQTQGSVGGRVNLRSRGPNSISVSNEPIVVIDGIRYTTAVRLPFDKSNASVHSAEPTSPLNDLNPNDIESIEVVKGPSAATMYGTDAANGVIVITTKRGRPGPARWNAFAKRTTMNTPTDRIPDTYWGWGTVFGVPSNPRVSCTLERLASGECTQQDSITALPSVLRNPEYTVIAAKPTSEYGINVSGGTKDLRYYFSGDYRDEVGPVEMPVFFQKKLMERLGRTELPRKWREPNTATNLNLRSNVSVMLSPKAELRVSPAFIRSSTNAATYSNNPYERGINRVTPADPIGYASTPDASFARESTDDVHRFVVSAGSVWRPMAWLSSRATLGVDLLGSRRFSLREEGIRGSGEVQDQRTRQMATTADVGISATAERGSLSARTSVGMQYAHTLNDASGVHGQGLAPGQSVVPGARDIRTAVAYSESAVLGGYIEEMVGWNNRLFLTGAARMDGASAFGKNFQAAIYPKVGASWLLTSEPFMPHVPGLDEVRLRVALGAAGQQPDPTWMRPTFFVGNAFVNGRQVSTYRVSDVGNPDLRPERTRELEFGVDIGAVENRVRVEATSFARRTMDQLIVVPSPPGLGTLRDNVGLTTQRGYEAIIDARVLDTRAVSVDVRLQHSYYTTKLEDLGGGRTESNAPSRGTYREGYPLGSRFLESLVGWNDQNGDGIVLWDELVPGDTLVYGGQSFPPRTQTVSTTFGFLERRARMSVLLERKSGFTALDPYACHDDTCRALVDPTTPLREQAEARFGVAKTQPGDFVRLREVSLAVDIPRRLVSTLGLDRGTVVFSGRNLALWSKFGGTDPEINGSYNGAMNNLGGGEAYGIPLARVVSVRLDLGI